MKREEFLSELREAGCEFKRHGGSHDIWTNSATGKSAPVPRHPAIALAICRRIWKQLGLPPRRL